MGMETVDKAFGFRTQYGTLYVEWCNEYSVRVFTVEGISERSGDGERVIQADQPLVVQGYPHHVEAYFHNGGCNRSQPHAGEDQSCPVHGFRCHNSQYNGCRKHHGEGLRGWFPGRVTTEADAYRSLRAGDVDPHTTAERIMRGKLYNGVYPTAAKRKIIEPLIGQAVDAAVRTLGNRGAFEAKLAGIQKQLDAALARAAAAHKDLADAQAEADRLLGELTELAGPAQLPGFAA